MFTPTAIRVFFTGLSGYFMGRQIQLIWAAKFQNEAMKA
jgi:hypothetical protein